MPTRPGHIMAPTVYLDNNLIRNIKWRNSNLLELKLQVSSIFGVCAEDLYVTINGKIFSNDYELKDEETVIRCHTKLVGGKGGFGSMLRAIGAQIEKTTNREACRDLSGRRLRDINEEKRLRKWLEGQADREKEAAERKQKKLERLTTEPKLTVKIDDPVYENERQCLPERVSAAVDAGWEASSSSSLKRKAEQPNQVKKKKLWIDADLSECSSGSDTDDEGVVNETNSPDRMSPGALTTVTDSGNESDQVSVTNKVM